MHTYLSLFMYLTHSLQAEEVNGVPRERNTCTSNSSHERPFWGKWRLGDWAHPILQAIQLCVISPPWLTRSSQAIGSESYRAVAAALAAPNQLARLAQSVARSIRWRGISCWALQRGCHPHDRIHPPHSASGCGTASAFVLGGYSDPCFLGWCRTRRPLAHCLPG